MIQTEFEEHENWYLDFGNSCMINSGFNWL